EDDLLRIFGGERISGIMERMGMREDEEIQHPLLSRAIANAQRKVEAHNFQIRKNLLEFDDVMNQQRATVYSRRREILAGENNRELVLDMIDQCVTEIVEENIPVSGNDPFDPASIEEPIRQRFNLPFSFGELPAGIKGQEAIGQILFERVVKYYEEREAQNDPEIMNKIARILMLQTLDQLWKDHLLQMDHLKEGIGLRGYAQKDPLLEYKKEGFLMFRNMMASFTIDVVEKLFRVQVTSSESVARAERIAKRMPAVEVHPSAGAFASEEQARPRAKSATQPLPLEFSGVGRNDPCPCGSGKKYKKCHGA
ncbi:MAG: SEC-C domain-containing protein, partial [Deltaproteobacteria bacterium]|nr:SEC-C domain-containing protein [Deltaproteobacteria bacterium]